MANKMNILQAVAMLQKFGGTDLTRTPSVIASKPAIRDQPKTGQRSSSETALFYTVWSGSGKACRLAVQRFRVLSCALGNRE